MNDARRDELLVRIDENVKALVRTGADHEKRLRGLEKSKNWAIGAMAAISYGMSWVRSAIHGS